MPVIEKELNLRTSGGNHLAVTKFSADAVAEQVIVISSATGVLQKYYHRFARYCAARQVPVYTFDYNGIGRSLASNMTLKEHQGNLVNWGRHDQAAVVALARKEHPKASLTLITHSIGGQILGFNPNYAMIDKVIMIASQGGYWNDFNGIHRLKMWLFWHVLIPAFTPVFGYFPARHLGLFENLPKQMVYQWASWGKKKNYMMHYRNERDYYFDKIEVPMLSWSFPKDSYAPLKTVDWLTKQYEKATVERVHYAVDNKKQPRHFGFFKPAFEDPLWQQNLNWIVTNTLS